MITTDPGYYATSDGRSHVILHGKSLCGRIIAVQPSLVEPTAPEDGLHCVWCSILLTLLSTKELQ